MHRVAITGIGLVSCLGLGADKAAEALYAGRSGITVDPERQALGFASPLTGRVQEPDAKALLSRKHRKTMPDFALWSYACCLEALEMAELPREALANAESGVIFGSDSAVLAHLEQVELLKKRGSTSSIGSGVVFRGMNSTVTMNLSTLFKTRGANWTVSSACSSGANAVGQAADLIAAGRQERVLCGGAQEVNWQSVCSFDALGAFSRRTDQPAAASRPFDRERDGLVPSGGAAAILLERRDLAEKRGARILGEIAGYGFSSDGEHVSVPSRTGLARAIRMALASAGAGPERVDYICAHATSTPAGDAAEAANIKAVFGASCPPTSSTKSLTGHELWMSGAAQVCYTVLMARDNFMAANANFTAPDDDTSGVNVITSRIDTGPKFALLHSAGFGGTNACLVLACP